MPAEESCAAAAAIDDVAASTHVDGKRAGCSCLPFYFWGSSRGAVTAPERRRRRLRLRLRLTLPWISWPWLRRSGKKNDDDGTKARRKKRRRGRMLLLHTPSRAKKAPASASPASSSLLPKVSSFGEGEGVGDAKKQSRGEPRRTVDEAAPTTSCRETAYARPETGGSQPCASASASARPTGDGVGRAGAPSWRAHSLRPDRGAEPGGGAGLWTVATTLGVVVFFGRITAVIFLCSCLYGARFVRAQAGRAAKAMGGGGGGSGSGRFGDRAAVELQYTEEHKKKVVMEGLLDRAGTRLSSRFCR